MYKELIKLAADCDHIGERVSVHRFALLNATLVLAAAGEKGLLAVKVNERGVSLDGMIVDVHAALEAVLWEDQHCATCCEGLARVVKVNGGGLRLICAPTKIGDSKMGAVAVVVDQGVVVDEYWTD